MATERKLYATLASLLSARKNCERTGNTEWFDRHTGSIESLVRKYMPSGSGIDNGTVLDLDASTPNRLVFTFGFHHMNENGYYDGWTHHTCVVTPDLASGYDLRITGRDRNGIKDYLGETFGYALECMVYQDGAGDWHDATHERVAIVG